MSVEMIARAPVTPFRQLREDREFYIPNYLAGEHEISRADLYAAADDHARELRKAERHLDDAFNLVGVLRAALQEADNRCAVQADTALKMIEKLLTKAQRCVDRHDTRFMNLFMAYFDSRNDESAPGDG